MKIRPEIRKTTGVSPSAKHRDQAERVVDRAADVAVGGGEEGAGPENPLETAALGRVWPLRSVDRPGAGGET